MSEPAITRSRLGRDNEPPSSLFSPDYMVGYAGVARCLLMLDRGEWWPEPVDVAWPRRFTATLAATAGAR